MNVVVAPLQNIPGSTGNSLTSFELEALFWWGTYLIPTQCHGSGDY